MKFLKKLTVCILCVFIAALLGCTEKPYSIIDNYSSYLSQLYQYWIDEGFDETVPGESGDEEIVGPKPDEEYQFIKAEQYEGLKSLTEYKFDFALNFFGKHAFAYRDNEYYLIDASGGLKLIETNDDSTLTDIVIESIEFDKILFKERDFYGVMDLSGKVFVECRYNNIEIFENIILAYGENKTDLFVNDSLLHTINSTNVAFLDADFILADGKVLKITDLSEPLVSGYRMAEAPSDGMVKIINEKGDFGYSFYPETDVIIEPQYIIAGSFMNGVSCVYKHKSDFINMIFYDYPLLIDKNNFALFDFGIFKDQVLPDKIKVYGNYDNCNIFYIDTGVGSFGVVETNDVQNIEYYKLDFIPKNNRVYGRYVIADGIDRLYSLDEKRFVDVIFKSIQPVKDKFIIQNYDGSYMILNENMEVIVNCCESIEFYDDILLIKQNSMYAYYEIVTT